MNAKKWIIFFMLLPIIANLVVGGLSALFLGGYTINQLEFMVAITGFLLLLGVFFLLLENWLITRTRLTVYQPILEGVSFLAITCSIAIVFIILNGGLEIIWYKRQSTLLYRLANHFNSEFPSRLYENSAEFIKVVFYFSLIGLSFYTFKLIRISIISFSGRRIFYITSFVLSIILLLALNTERKWENNYRNIYDDIYELTYFNLLKDKPLIVKDTQISLLELGDWPEKKEFLALVSAISKSKPSVIGICSGFPYSWIKETNFIDELARRTNKTKIVAFAGYYSTQSLSTSIQPEIVSAGSFFEKQDYFAEWNRYDNRFSLPLYFESKQKGGFGSDRSELGDLGVKIYDLHLTHGHQNKKYKSDTSDDKLLFSEILNKADGKMLISYLCDPRYMSFRLEHVFPYYWYLPVGKHSELPTKSVITVSTDRGNSRILDLSNERILAKDALGEWTIKEDNLPNVRGKIFLISVGQHRLAYTYISMIQSIYDNKLVDKPSSTVYGIVTFLILVCIVMMYFKLNHWVAFLTSIIALLASVISIIVLYYVFNVLYNPGSLTIAILCTMVFYLPYEILRDYRRVLEERLRYASELKAAHDMQMGLMPKEDPGVPGYDISGVCFPANEVGGDYYDYLWLDDEKNLLGIAVVDVSGKAMKAAITAVMTSGLVYNEISSNGSPRSILRKINRPMYLKTDRNVFTALSFAVIDLKTKILTFSNAGQMRPLLRRGGLIEYIQVEGPRLPLGVQEEVAYNEVSWQLQSDDVLVLFTDGIIEAKNSKDEFWGFEKMEEVVKNLPSIMSAKEMSDALIAEANRFKGTARQHDDMTVVVVRVL